VLKADLQRAFKKTTVFLNKFLQVGVAIGQDQLSIMATNSDVGNTTDELHAEVVGSELSLNFNQHYVAEPLAHIPDESIRMRFAGIGRPLVMVGMTDQSIRYLVMPMNK
jgi:DNA polymerase III sliding clamp (beta) subunit (PCNA family)